MGLVLTATAYASLRLRRAPGREEKGRNNEDLYNHARPFDKLMAGGLALPESGIIIIRASGLLDKLDVHMLADSHVDATRPFINEKPGQWVPGLRLSACRSHQSVPDISRPTKFHFHIHFPV